MQGVGIEVKPVTEVGAKVLETYVEDCAIKVKVMP
jgi:hypothetical protein